MTNTTQLPRRYLGSTGLSVPALCIGCASLGDMPETFDYSVSRSQAHEAIRAIFAGPITFVDTAASYGDGESERRIGIVLRELGGLPEGFVLATKADRDLTTDDFSGEQMRRSVHRSLELLGLDRLQLLYLHDPEHTTFDVAMAPGGAVEALMQMRSEGLIDHLGLAGGPIEQMIRYVRTGLFEVGIAHNRYTLLNTSAAPFWDACIEKGMACVNAAPFGSGILVQGPERYPRYAYQAARGDVLDRTRRLEAACRKHGVPLAAAALQFSMRDPRISSTIAGVGRAEQVSQLVEFATCPIPEELWSELSRITPSTLDDVEVGRFSPR